MFKNFKFSESNFFANAVIIIAVVVLSTLVLYSPFLAKVFKDSNNNQIGFERIYQNYDGLYYVVSAMTFYNPKAIESLKLEFDLPNEYYAAHLPLYPFFIFLFSLMFGYLKSMILVNTLFTIALSFAFYYLLSFFKLSKKPLILVIVFLFLPRFLVIRSVGAPETLFLTLIILSIIFFEKKNYFLAAFLGALSVATKTPGILLFGAYGLVFLEKIIREKTFKFSFLWIGLIPVGLLAVFSFYQTQYNDFFAYFHTGGVVPMPYPFSVFSSAAKWVGTIWLEDVVLYFFIYGLAVINLKDTKYRSLFYFPLTFLLFTIFVQHRDLSRYLLPIWPFAAISFEKLFTSKKFLIIFIILLPAIYFYAWNFIISNIIPISDWSPFI